MTQTLARTALNFPSLRAILFSITLFLSAALMFAVQPMIGKMLLPLAGGSPSGWLVAIAFFQLVLLAGYGAAHALALLPPPRHIFAVLLILAAGLLVLPLKVDVDTSSVVPSAWSVLKALLFSVGLPFFALSTLSSSLQRLFSSSSGHKADPYFLFAASNLGSFAGLLFYPFWLERHFGLAVQTGAWQVVYMLLISCCVACLFVAGRSAEIPAVIKSEPVSWQQRRKWIFLSFLPSSLLLGVTSYLTVEHGSIPLFWVIPLALYLLTFVVAFAHRRLVRPDIAAIMQPLALTFIIFMFLERPFNLEMLFGEMFFPLAAFFFMVLLCHIALSSERPHASQLTEYYLWIAVGGALGGIFNVFVVPFIFPLPIEFLVMALAVCFIHPGFPIENSRAAKIVLPIAVIVAFLTELTWATYGPERVARAALPWGGKMMPLSYAVVGAMGYFLAFKFLTKKDSRAWAKNEWIIVVFIILVAIAVFFQQGITTTVESAVLLSLLLSLAILGLWPMTFVRIAPILCILAFFIQSWPTLVDVERNFFGVWRVYEVQNGDITERIMTHGSTVHDVQQVGPNVDTTPWAYYSQVGPLGDIFKLMAPKDIAVIGLGAGAIACYLKNHETIRFFEIDPAAVDLASKRFAYMSLCGNPTVILGDGRRSMTSEKPSSYDLIVLDAFTSDMIPMHLLTREAFAVYFEKLKPNGILALDISNRYYDLAPALAKVAHSLGLYAEYKDSQESMRGDGTPQGARDAFAFPSSWLVVARSETTVQPFFDNGWKDPVPATGRVWTDDYSDLLSTMRFAMIW